LCLLLLVSSLLLSVVGVASVSADFELAYDDGSFETNVILQNYWDTALQRTHLRQKFVLSDFPQYTLTQGWVKVEAVEVCWGSPTIVIDTVVFDIRLRDGDGTPITALSGLTSPVGVTPPFWSRYDDVSSAGFTSNSYFYVELIAKSGAEYVAADSGQLECSEYSTDENGVAWTQEAVLHYGIRVIVSKLLGPVPEFSLSIPIVASIATVAYLAIRKRISRKLE